MRSSLASDLRPRLDLLVHFIKKMRMGVITPVQDQLCNLWDSVQTENTGSLV